MKLHLEIFSIALLGLPLRAATLPATKLPSSCAASLREATGDANASAEKVLGGYRVVSERRDAVLGMHWAMVEECAHPERPLRLVQVTTPVAVAGQTGVRGNVFVADDRPMLVRSGQTVTLWSADENVRVKLQAIAEQSGRAGESIWVRLKRLDGNTNVDGVATTRRRGIVRSVGSVELEP